MAIQLDPHKAPGRTRPAPRFTRHQQAGARAHPYRPRLRRIMKRRAPLPGVSTPNVALAGLGLIAAGLAALLRPLAERYLRLRAALVFSYGARLLDLLAPFAAAGAALLGLSFFLLDGLPLPWFAPSIAYGGAIDTGLFLAVASVILIVAQLRQQRQRA